MLNKERYKYEYPEERSDLSDSIQRHKRLVKIISLSAIAVIIVVALACTLPNAIHNAILTKQVRSYLDGMCFIEKGKTCLVAYSFNGNTMGHEYWFFSEHTPNGDINETFIYKATGTIGSDKVQLWYKDDGKWWYGPEAVLCEDGSVEFSNVGLNGTWRLSSMDEINSLRSVTLCAHEFGQDNIVKAATCSGAGEATHTCKICGYTETLSIAMLEHNYKDKICTLCGAKKQPEKASIQANTWYIYDNSVLSVQNCLVANAVSVKQGKAMTVMYHAVCQSCHAIDDDSKLAGPEIGYDVQKIHYCDECGTATLVKLKIG